MAHCWKMMITIFVVCSIGFVQGSDSAAPVFKDFLLFDDPAHADHAATADASVATAWLASGYIDKGRAGSVQMNANDKSCSNLIPIYSQYCSDKIDHIWTWSSSALDGYSRSGETVYCSTVEGDCGATVPIYIAHYITNVQTNNHDVHCANKRDQFISTSLADYEAATSRQVEEGWWGAEITSQTYAKDGILCYIWP